MSDAQPLRKPPDFNWRLSQPHIWLLTTFLVAHPASDVFLEVDWRRALGEEPADAIDRFREQGQLDQAPLAVRAAVQFDRHLLSELLRERRLPAMGTTEEMVDRLVTYDEATLTSLTRLDLLECTAQGRAQALTYLSDSLSVILRVDISEPISAEVDQLSSQEMKLVLRWLVANGVVWGPQGQDAFNFLKKLARQTGEPGPDDPVNLITSLDGWAQLSWCPVPAGYFMMGTGRRQVSLPAFSISEYPVTNLDYMAFVQAQAYAPPKHWHDGRIPLGKENHPVVYVTYDDAVNFAAWVSELSGDLVGVPSEAEWEKAARGPDGRPYPWGNKWLRGRGNSLEDGVGDTTPVDKYVDGGSPYGVYDLAGNVFEWTSSFWEDDENWQVMRGGAWNYLRGYMHAAARIQYRPFSRNFNIGFRVVRRLAK